VISLYLSPPGFAHRLPAGLKLGALALVSLLATLTDSLPAMAVLLAAVLALYAALGRAALRKISLLRPLLPLLVILAAFHWWNGDALLGVAPRAVALAVAMTIRFVPLLFALWQALGDSYRARTGRAGGWRLLAPFCIQTLRLAHHVGEALAARGGAPRVSQEKERR